MGVAPIPACRALCTPVVHPCLKVRPGFRLWFLNLSARGVFYLPLDQGTAAYFTPTPPSVVQVIQVFPLQQQQTLKHQQLTNQLHLWRSPQMTRRRARLDALWMQLSTTVLLCVQEHTKKSIWCHLCISSEIIRQM